jgi:hypothetical protein
MGERGGKRGKELGGLNQSREREQRGEETKGRGEREKRKREEECAAGDRERKG